MPSKLLTNNLRAAGTWLATPVGLVVGWVLYEWFFSTHLGAIVGLIGGSLALLVLVAAISGWLYIIKE
jgi:hypothetical protein